MSFRNVFFFGHFSDYIYVYILLAKVFFKYHRILPNTRFLDMVYKKYYLAKIMMTFMKKKANITILIRCMYTLYALDTVNRVSENVVLKVTGQKKSNFYQGNIVCEFNLLT